MHELLLDPNHVERQHKYYFHCSKIIIRLLPYLSVTAV